MSWSTFSGLIVCTASSLSTAFFLCLYFTLEKSAVLLRLLWCEFVWLLLFKYTSNDLATQSRCINPEGGDWLASFGNLEQHEGDVENE